MNIIIGSAIWDRARTHCPYAIGGKVSLQQQESWKYSYTAMVFSSTVPIHLCIDPRQLSMYKKSNKFLCPLESAADPSKLFLILDHDTIRVHVMCNSQKSTRVILRGWKGLFWLVVLMMVSWSRGSPCESNPWSALNPVSITTHCQCYVVVYSATSVSMTKIWTLSTVWINRSNTMLKKLSAVFCNQGHCFS